MCRLEDGQRKGNKHCVQGLLVVRGVANTRRQLRSGLRRRSNGVRSLNIEATLKGDCQSSAARLSAALSDRDFRAPARHTQGALRPDVDNDGGCTLRTREKARLLSVGSSFYIKSAAMNIR